ncbi:MAG TPA: inorganic phosphate transporter [Spirochaetota bacterium]|nr:inorganic phosphate transporter [Spirochaetota bacterium]HPS85837.1 inorganic phosphate transporter [Spirochaetota bacterium]
MSILIFLSSGLFLGWSVGANDMGNVFGTAVGSKMVRFKVAAVVASIFIVLGCFTSGGGATLTLGRLGSVNEIGGSFIVALAAAIAVFWMSRLNLPVSTSQSIVGSLIGWNFFSGSITDYDSLMKIVSSWMFAPVVSGVVAVFIYFLVKRLLNRIKIHILYLDFYNRFGLIVIGAFGAYSLGANNIANVMGVFVPVAPFRPINTYIGTISGSEQLFILGGIAMAVGVFTYSARLMRTVGNNIIPLTPVTALVVVFSSSTVLFLFSSQNLERILATHGLPTIPLVPISSAQAVVGAIIGIGLYQGGGSMNLKLLGKIASGWVTAPVLACVISFVSLFIIQNVFNQAVYKPVRFSMSAAVERRLVSEGITFAAMEQFIGKEFRNAIEFKKALISSGTELDESDLSRVVELSELRYLIVNTDIIEFEISQGWFTPEQTATLKKLNGRNFKYSWELRDELEAMSPDWKLKKDTPEGRHINRNIISKLDYIYKKFWVIR